MTDQEALAKAFHERYERTAPLAGYETRPESAVSWDEVPPENRALMVEVAGQLLQEGVVRPGPALNP